MDVTATTPIRTIRARTVVLAADDVDTDQIIPARFLTTTRRDGFGDALFADWRFDGEGQPRPGFALNDPQTRGAGVLVAGRNFGCGSSREHAAWALRDYGFRAVVAGSFADIFRNNALKNGLLPVAVPGDALAWLTAHPGVEVTIDLEATTLAAPGLAPAPFPVEPFARYRLLNGIDELGYLLSRSGAIDAYERSRGA
ncbi:MAG: 3-isopropylmalate dehydratase small subunit [Gammaproteobacteria bacterium]|nr:3-isopropylmalate dehydratase small subunit [Gammaproteobacteria bacterium]